MNFSKRGLKVLGLLTFLCIGLNGYSQISWDGLVGYFKLDGNADDYSPYNHRTSIVDPATPTTDRFGDAGKAMLLNGGYISAGNPVPFQITDAISVSIWVNPTRISDWSAIVTKWGGTNVGGYYLGINPMTKKVRWNLRNPTPLEGNVVPIGNWTHIVSTYDGSTMRIYENGTLVSEQAYSNKIVDPNATLVIGGQHDLPFLYKFYGAVDDVIVYNRALSTNEVSGLYNSQLTNTDKIVFEEKVKVLPNPSNGVFSIEVEGVQEMPYTVFDAQGMKLLEGITFGNLDISHLSAGIYHLRLNVNDVLITKKLVLN